MRFILKRSGLAIALFFLSLPVLAHHSAAMYDHDIEVSLNGVVTEYEWANPHVYLFVEAETDTGDSAIWAIENGPTTAMARRGWSRDTFSRGDRVRVTGNPANDPGRKMILITSVAKAGVMLLDGRGLSGLANYRGAVPAANDLSGTWEVPMLQSLFYTFFGDPWVPGPGSWPLTEKGVEAVESYDEATMHPLFGCVSRPAPMIMVFPSRIQIEVGEESIVIRTGYDAVERIVHMHGATTPVENTLQGHSIGRWEEEDRVLVVETTNFVAHQTGNAEGLSSGLQKRLLESFELNADGTGLNYRFELRDPEYLSEPVTGEIDWAYRPDVEFAQVECNPENARRFLAD